MNADLHEMPSEGPVTRLHLRDERIMLEVLGGHKRGAQAIDAGSARKVLERIRHEPATADELESAISDIEDDLMPAIGQLPTHRRLVTSEPGVLRIAKLLGSPDPSAARLELAEIEQLFNRLADVAYGMPAAALGILTDRSFAATLLIVREVLHHGGFASVEVMQ
jgi:hypothetical protein